MKTIDTSFEGFVSTEKSFINSTLKPVTFQGNSDKWSLNTGLIHMKCTVKGNKN